MSYQQGTGDLQRTKVAASVTLGSSNGAASVTVNGARGTLTVTLSANLVFGATHGPITMTNSAIKANSVIESCALTNHAVPPFEVYAVQDGSCKLTSYNLSGAQINSGTAIKYAFMVYN